ncbi:MAG: beta-propeller fold lactonase family protein [Gemmatimonadota bacterium]
MNRIISLATLLGVVAVSIATASVGGPDTPGRKLYIVNQSGASITVVDQTSFKVDTVLDLKAMGFTSNAKPHHVVVEPDGSFWYVSLIGDGRVLKLDRANHLVGQVPMETPGLLAIDPKHDSLYVGRSMTAVNPPKSVAVIKRSTFTKVEEQEVELPRPHALLATRDGKWFHTASLAENRIASVETATGRVTLSTLPGVPRSMVQFAQSPDGKTMVVGGELSNTLMVFDLTRPPPFTPVREIPLAGKPWDPMFSPDGKTVFVSLFAANAIAVIDVEHGTIRRTITGEFAQPYDVILRHDGKYLFVVNQNTGALKPGESAHDHMPGMAGSAGAKSTDGWLSVIDVKKGTVVKTVMLGAGPTGMGAAGAR